MTGLILAVLVALQPLTETGDLNLKRDWFRFLISILMAIFGFISKDFDKTGTAKNSLIGSRPNDR